MNDQIGFRGAPGPFQRFQLCLAAVLTLLAMSATAATYSPVVADDFPTNVFWGDTHIHTWLSGDAFGMGTRETPDQAYRFARGEQVRATGGEMVQLRRPLDFAMVADHAANLGMLALLISRDERVLKTSDGAKYYELLSSLPVLSDVLNAESAEVYRTGVNDLVGKGKVPWGGNFEVSDSLRQEVWQGVIEVAEKYNTPGQFTTFAGYEYSSAGPMLHRNVMFVGGPDQTSQTRPFSRDDSRDPADLWADLLRYRAETGSDVIAIPHNSNLSGGNMFRGATYMGQPLTAEFARTRASLEPVVEVTQIKGDSETHPYLSPDDEFADYETWGKFGVPPAKTDGGKGTGKGKETAKSQVKAPVKAPIKSPTKAPAKASQKIEKTLSLGSVANANNSTQEALARQSYVRSGLQLGLQHEQALGTNPFKLGMIGSTDSHTGLATADDDNFWGKMGSQEPGPYRAEYLTQFDASGYAAVWAQENTRESIFAAFRRREVYASTGPRIRLRFFGGWSFQQQDILRPNFAKTGYAQGVPMGGDLVGNGQNSESGPGFLIHAARDPDGANLDRVQVIKGWLTKEGDTKEQVYDVAWSDNRKVDASGRLEPIKSTVDVPTATYTNSVGSPELGVMWQDPEFDPDEAAFYYVRVLQIPTPRWTAYDAAFYGLNLPDHIPVVTQERAYSSPIWYTPAD